MAVERGWRARVRLAAWGAALALLAGAGGGATAPVAARPVDAGRDATRQAGRPALAVTTEPFVSSGLSDPVFLAHAGDGSGRLFVVEKGGRIKLVINGQVQPTPFLDLTGTGPDGRPWLTATGFEQGLLGLAFHPSFETNGRFYVYYTPPPPDPNPNSLAGFNALAEFRVTTPGANQASLATYRLLFSVPDRLSNHNGGMLAFGPDGYLYVGIGDEGGIQNAGNAQNLANLFGKVLRIDVDGGAPYGIPPDNPFVGQSGARPEIWAYGLRNPWRWSFDRATGDLWLSDVGQDKWEEIDRQPAGPVNAVRGRNYGWPIMEGAHCFPNDPCNQAGLILPTHEYASDGGDCSVTGGYVYRGSRSPVLVGAYLFGDFCSGRIWALTQAAGGAWQATVQQATMPQLQSFGEDEAGEVYAVGKGGTIVRLVDTTPPPPSCAPRPNVGVRVVPSGTGTVAVTVTANTNLSVGTNGLRALHFGEMRNARVVVDGVERPAGASVPLAGAPRDKTFTVHRIGPGATTVHLDVEDACGRWPTFVGAGAGVP